MNREICIIERIHDGFYYLKSIKGMRYKVNGLKMKEYEKGQHIIISYENSAELSDGVYYLEPQKVTRYYETVFEKMVK